MLALESVLQVMTTASNLLLVVSLLRWAQMALLNSSNVTNKPLTLSQPAPLPLFESLGNRHHFDDIYDGDITKLSQRLNRSESAVVLFYAPWSRSSLHFKPIFERLASKHAQHNFEFIAVNCWQPGPNTCRQAFSLKGGYPYVSFFTHYTGHVFYNGVLSESEVLYFIYRFIYPFYSAADNSTLAGLRMLSQSQILILVPINDTQVVESTDLSPRNFASRALKIDQTPLHKQMGVPIKPDLFKTGIRSVIVGTLSVFVPNTVFPRLRPMLPYFFMPNLQISAIPTNWTGWLPPIKPKPIKIDTTNETTVPEETGTFIDRGVDRAVVAVINSFLAATGPQFCNPGVASLRAASRLHNECLSPNSSHSDLLTHVTISLTVEERQCQQLRQFSLENSPPISFKVLQNSGEDLSRMSEIVGLGCSPENGGEAAFSLREPFQTAFAAVERNAGVGVVFNESASPSANIGPRRPLQVAPAIYLLDGRRERPPRLINVSFSEENAVTSLVDWLKERDQDTSKIRLPKWLPETEKPTLVYYEAPWCVFCSILTPRILLATRTIERAVPSFRLVRVTDAQQTVDATQSSIDSNVFSVPHYPSLVFYPHGTIHSVSFKIPHSPGSATVPAIWRHLSLADKLLSCNFMAGVSSCWRRQLTLVRSLQRRLWQRSDELFYIDDDLNVRSDRQKMDQFQLARFASRLHAIFNRRPFLCAHRLVVKELARFNALGKLQRS